MHKKYIIYVHKKKGGGDFFIKLFYNKIYILLQNITSFTNTIFLYLNQKIITKCYTRDLSSVNKK